MHMSSGSTTESSMRSQVFLGIAIYTYEGRMKHISGVIGYPDLLVFIITPMHLDRRGCSVWEPSTQYERSRQPVDIVDILGGFGPEILTSSRDTLASIVLL